MTRPAIVAPWVIACIVFAGCTGEPRLPCTNDHPRGTDCSYGFRGLRANANHAEDLDTSAAYAALDSLGWPARIAPDGDSVSARNGSHFVSLRAAQDGSWFEWAYETPGFEGLTKDEVSAEAERLCAAGPGPEMERILASIERELGWERIGGGICQAQMFVVD